MVQLKSFNGEEARKYFSQTADMRLAIFKEFPYFYKGNYETEKQFLGVFFNSQRSLILLVFDGDKVVGCSSSVPLDEESNVIQQPFLENNLNPKNYLYIGEVMLKKPYRGQGLLRKFFEHHENHAKAHGLKYPSFMTVKRPHSHSLRPSDYRDLGPIWQHFGYKLMPGMVVKSSWIQSDTLKEEHNELNIWVKNSLQI